VAAGANEIDAAFAAFGVNGNIDAEEEMVFVDEEITSRFIERPIMDTAQVKLNHWIWIDCRRTMRSEPGIG
jgi:hypothetical protein